MTSTTIKTLALAFLLFPLQAFPSEESTQIFNDFTGALQISAINYRDHSVRFSGSQKADGEIVFEMADDGSQWSIRAVVFVPSQPRLFPEVTSGFYAKELVKIELVKSDEIKQLLFSESEWQQVISKKLGFVSRRGTIEIREYVTSVECDSRFYSAELVAFKSSQSEISYAQDRPELAGC